MLRICIPVHNEATTIGVLLWRLRTVFQGFSREYDVVVYDDASTDSTTETLEPYRAVMPLTVLRGARQLGYAGSVDALVRHVAADDEYARRDAMVLLQGDFTECPEHLPELVKRFEGGADLVAVDRAISNATPPEERRIRRWGPWAMKPFLSLPPVADPFTGFRLVRISVLRDLIKVMGNAPVCSGEGWAANVDFALNVAPFARRIENVTLTPRYDVRQRPSRRRGWPDVLALFHWARGAKRVRRPIPGAKAATEAPTRDRGTDPNAPTVSAPRAPLTARAERPERTERDRFNRAEGGRPPRGDARNGGRPGRDERPTRTERPEREEPAAVAPTAPVAPVAPAATEKPARPPREPRPPRAERPPRRERSRPDVADAEGTPLPDADELVSVQPDAADDGVTAAGIDAQAEPKRARRRRRRGRRDREPRAEGAATDDGDPPAAGTSDDRQGEQEDNGGDSEPDDANEQTETGATGDAGRRKRRSRRRRRSRRPGEVGGGSDDAAAPPAVEPPTA